MGWFSRRKTSKVDDAASSAIDDPAQIQERIDSIDTMIDAVDRSARGDLDGLFEGDDGSLVLKSGEFTLARIDNSGLLETQRAPSTYQGGYGGVSFPLFGGVRVHTGGVKGRRVPGAESLTYVEDGTVYITNKRAVFVGAANTVEWPFTKVVACEHNALGYTTFALSGRKKNSGFGYGKAAAAQVQFRIEWGIALCNETTDRLLTQLHVERDKLAPPDAAAPAS